MRMIAAKWKLWIVILITSLLRVDGAAKLVLLTISRSWSNSSKKKDRKEGQKLIQGAMIRKDGRRKTKREVDSPLADFSCPITLFSRVSFSFEESKAFACRRLFWEESTSFDPSAITTCPGAQLSKELSLLTSQPKSKTKNLCAVGFVLRNIDFDTREIHGWTLFIKG